MHSTFLATLLLLAAAGGAAAHGVPAGGQGDARAGGQERTLAGIVVDSASGAPLAGAVVRVQETRLAAVTGGDGRFTLHGVPAGGRLVTVQLLGYGTGLRVAGAEESDLGRLVLATQPLVLEGVQVTLSRMEERHRRHPRRVLAASGTEVRAFTGNVLGLVKQRFGVVPHTCPMIAGGRDGAFAMTDYDPGEGTVALPCMALRGNNRVVRVYIDEQVAQGGYSDLELYNTLDVHTVEVYPADAAIRVYTHEFVERAARGRFQLRPIPIY